MKDIMKMVCYMDEEDVYKLAEAIIDGDIDGDVIKLLPYMDEEDVGKLALEIAERGVDINCIAMAPYMDGEDIYRLVKLGLERKINIDLKSFIPLMDEDYVDEICRLLADNPSLDSNLSPCDLYQYASNDAVDNLFLHYASQGKFDKKALPFVSDDCLHRFVLSYCEKQNFDVDIDELYPYLSGEDISLLLKTYLQKNKKQ